MATEKDATPESSVEQPKRIFARITEDTDIEKLAQEIADKILPRES